MGGVLDPPLHGQEEGLGAAPGLEPGEHLGGEGGEPAEPVGPGDGHDALVGEVHHGAGGPHEGALLAQRVAVVGGHPAVQALGLDGARPVEQGGTVLGHGTQPIFRSCAEAWVVRGSPSAAMSQAQNRSPWTRPYMRVEELYSLAPRARITASVARSIRGPLICPA